MSLAFCRHQIIIYKIVLFICTSETCACKINQDSYHTALNHVFIGLLWSWVSRTARQSLQGGRAALHGIGCTPCSELLSLLLPPAVGIGCFRCCCLLDTAANLLKGFQYGKMISFSCLFTYCMTS